MPAFSISVDQGYLKEITLVLDIMRPLILRLLYKKLEFLEIKR